MLRTLLAGSAAVLWACAAPGPAVRAGPPPAPADAPTPAAPPPPERLAADTPRTTAGGATFVAPARWTLTARGPATILEAPEAGSRVAIVDVHAADADAAVKAAWAAYRPDASWPLLVKSDGPDRDGWTDRRSYDYRTSPDERRDVAATVQRAGEVWTVLLVDLDQAIGEKRGADLSTLFGRLLPRGYARESFAGRKAHPLDAARVRRLTAWVEQAMAALGVPGAAVGLVQDGKVVFAGGFGVKELGKQGKPDADTLFMVGSNTKALTTLMLARLVAAGKLGWDTPVTRVLPSFKLGDAETTRQVEVKHLVCACTGLPRQDLERKFQFEGVTAAGAMALLATMQPTTRFGETFQYSNLLAGAGGFVGGHVLYPALELGAAYDEAMRTQVFEPLGMRRTTFDYAKALAGNHASPHAPDIDGKPSRAAMDVNFSVLHLRPAGAAWSSVRDLLRYVSMELAEGALPGGKPYLAKGPLLERRVPQVAIGSDDAYGMGLMVRSTYGTPVVHHGGDLSGFHSDMLWLPEHVVGAVVLTNADPGWTLRSLFQRELLEVLFDGHPEADAALAASAKAFFEQLAAERRLLTVPADPAEAARLARGYASPALGALAVSQAGGVTTFDFGEWRSQVATRKNPDGTSSFVTTDPGVQGFEFLVGTGPRPTLTIRDAQHEYVFEAR